MVIAVAVLILAGNALYHSTALADQGKRVITVKATYSVERVKVPSLLTKLLCTNRTCKPGFSCTASSPAEYAKVTYTVVSAVQKGIRKAALSGVKHASKKASKFMKNMVLVGKIVISL